MPRSSVAVIIFKGDEVLLVKNLAGSSHLKEIYGLPSGKVDPGETEIQAAVRELAEETGLQTSEDDLTEFPSNYYVAHIPYKDGSNHEWGWRAYLCKKYQGQLRATDETAPEWADIDTLDGYDLLPNIKNVITAALKFIKTL